MNQAQMMIDKLSAKVGSLTSQVVFEETRLEIANARIRELEEKLKQYEKPTEDGPGEE